MNGLLTTARKSIENNLISKIISNPVLLSIVIVLIITIILHFNSSIFTGIIFSILITTALIFSHNNIIKKCFTKSVGGGMESYFANIAEGSTSNIDNVERNTYNDSIDNLDINKFFDE